ncbi:glycosyltransferase family 2 protein [Paraburkholderia nemoris]|uniref:N-acetylglucosaminyl-diphospho-decaprenol L-rhamnosyltransferase n=1 Tax=Paraburkholderia nemoris TaxID=2793076 RepID=A0ABN7MKZ4_9BURK|nr:MULTISPECIES: glycosyltransferase family 2 protein [Paraburkholderia]MBK3813072.1 glycosyltransferase family 2 protein [Paraburkholderia aspalathi]CAE6799893.1 N-acetylglucosaminyl-diphospho-decaprenol L-rhamnosyltransferase [Paraburkholderia nemoris]CAE6811186.1 N-acetylglucosaminyl-diphospho-decaprenol L-rhamnosyltransferase [Paraburkholderia nemoris]
MSAFERINAIIVNYKTADLTRKCVESLIALNIALPEDVVVVENSSPDNSFKRLKTTLPAGVRLVRASINRGFGSGVNFGMVACRHDLVVVLNPDTYFTDRSIDRAINVMKNESDIGLVGLDLLYPNGRRQYSARRFYSVLDILARRSPLGKLSGFRRRAETHMMYDSWRHDSPFEAEWVMGTGFIVRREIFEDLGGMDERYFLYMEDVDFCARAWQAGYRVVCVPGAHLTHEHQRESAAGIFSWAGRKHLKSLLLFRSKYRLPWGERPGVDGLARR